MRERGGNREAAAVIIISLSSAGGENSTGFKLQSVSAVVKKGQTPK